MDMVENNHEEIKLTRFARGMGCGCKMNPAVLQEVLKGFRSTYHPDILVGSETSDDAAVYKINDEQAIVQTLDFFTPVVDDPFEFGMIAAANALSDIYAMGASPLFALNIVAFPVKNLPVSVLRSILSGAKTIATEAGIQILGGHTIDDPEPKFGMVVCGIVHPGKIKKNSGAKAGQKLVLTKPLGTGVLSAALKKGVIDPNHEIQLRNSMKRLNRNACEKMLRYNVSACTDVTGFGLTGHLKEMVESSGVGAVIYAGEIPLLPGANEYLSMGLIPGGTKNNMAFVSGMVDFEPGTDENTRTIVSDAQTSGGLLIAIDTEDASHLLKDLHATGDTSARIIGKTTVENPGRIKVVNFSEN